MHAVLEQDVLGHPGGHDRGGQVHFAPLTSQQAKLVDAFITDGVDNFDEPSEAARRVVADLLANGVIEFGYPHTRQEHLHVAHPNDRYISWCLECTRIKSRTINV
jgi:hypothetical protein